MTQTPPRTKPAPDLYQEYSRLRDVPLEQSDEPLAPRDEAVNHPKHYNSHPSGVECIQVVRHYSFNLGNVIKYIWRAGIKSENPIEDLKKAEFYLRDEIARLEAGK
jgi:hypothetical protein